MVLTKIEGVRYNMIKDNDEMECTDILIPDYLETFAMLEKREKALLESWRLKAYDAALFAANMRAEANYEYNHLLAILKAIK